MSSNISLNPSGPPETRLPGDPPEIQHLLAQVVASGTGEEARSALVKLVSLAPRSSAVWATYGSVATDVIERYAAYRVGYHRGLDALRANGWKGSGFVRWAHPGNQGFLRCLDGLRLAAEEIGESDEAERCRLFLVQLDPSVTPGT